MHSFHIHQARTGEAEVDIPDGIAAHTAALLVFSDHQLNQVRALLMQAVLAIVLVHLVDLVMATLELGDPLKAHRGDLSVRFRKLRGSQSSDCDCPVSYGDLCKPHILSHLLFSNLLCSIR